MVSDQNGTVGSFELHVEKVKTDLYDIYKEYMLKRMTSEEAVKGIINYITDINDYSEVRYTKHLSSLLIQVAVKLLIKINPKHPLFYKFLESNIVDDTLILNTRYHLYHIIEIYFPSKIEGIQKFVLRELPQYFPNNIEFEGREVIKAGLHGFFFQTYKTLNDYFPNSKYPFRWDSIVNGFSNENIFILKKKNDPYANDKSIAEYSYGAHKDWERIIKNGKKHFFIGKKYAIQLLYIGFSFQIFKLIINNFEEKNLTVSFLGIGDEIPIRVSYNNSDILLYFFASPSRNHETTPQPKGKRKIKRSEVIDLEWFAD